MRLSPALAAVVLAATAALAQPPSEAELRKEAGNYFLKKRQYDAARDQYLAALKLDEGYADSHYNLGVVYFFRLQDYPRALYHFVRYAQLRPDAPDLDQVKGLTLQALEKIESAEREEYGRALEKGTPEALKAFLDAHPSSPYGPDAAEKIRLLREFDEQVLRRQQETQAAYLEALAKGSPEAMDGFLQAHPDAPQAGEGLRLRNLWEAQRTEDRRAYEAALAQKTAVALEGFLKERPGSPLAPEARAQLERLKAGDEAYRIAAQSRSAPALEVFLATYTGTPREAEARALLETLRQEAAEKEEQERVAQSYRAATVARDPAALEAVLAAHPGAPQAAEARALLDQVRAEQASRESEAAAEAAFRAAVEAGSPAALEGFLAEHGASARAAQARAALTELKAEEEQRLARAEEARRRAEAEEAQRSAAADADRAWTTADRADTPEAYREFRERHPGHAMAEEARRREAVLTATSPPAPVSPPPVAPAAVPEPPASSPPAAAPAAAPAGVEAAWAAAKEADTPEVYEAFLAAHPEGDEAQAARSRLEELRAPAGDALDRYRRMLQGE